MKNHPSRRAFGIGALSLLALTACSGPDTGNKPARAADPDAKVTITVGDKPTPDKAEDLADFNAKVTAFEKLHPNIKVESSTEVWQAQTFQAKLSAGTLPTVMSASLTYAQSLIANKQLPNITPYLEQLDMLTNLNPLALKNVQDADGNVFTIPLGLFSVGLTYNRAIFERAGLDPNKPPTTWDEVRSYAKTISEKVAVFEPSSVTTRPPMP